MPDPSIGLPGVPEHRLQPVQRRRHGTGPRRGRASSSTCRPRSRSPRAACACSGARRGRLEVVSEDQLRSSAGLARIRLASDTELTGERRAVTCTYDERAHTLIEKVEVKLENKGKRAAEVVDPRVRVALAGVAARHRGCQGARARERRRTSTVPACPPAASRRSRTLSSIHGDPRRVALRPGRRHAPDRGCGARPARTAASAPGERGHAVPRSRADPPARRPRAAAARDHHDHGGDRGGPHGRRPRHPRSRRADRRGGARRA